MSAGQAAPATVVPRGTSLCIHNRRKNECRACKGSSICEHNKRRNECKDCNGASICEHRRRRRECKECGGSSICEHKMLKRRCKICKGASICVHNRRKNECKDCAGTSICEHNRLRRHCKQCGGTSICEHGRRRNVCKECKGVSICKHERRKSQCAECSKLETPPSSSHGSPHLSENSTTPFLPAGAMETLGAAPAGTGTNPFMLNIPLPNAHPGLLSPSPFGGDSQMMGVTHPGMVPISAPQSIAPGSALGGGDKKKPSSNAAASTAAMIALLRAQVSSLPLAPSSTVPQQQPPMSFPSLNSLNGLPLPPAPTPPLSRTQSLALLQAGIQGLTNSLAPFPQGPPSARGMPPFLRASSLQGPPPPPAPGSGPSFTLDLNSSSDGTAPSQPGSNLARNPFSPAPPNSFQQPPTSQP